MPWGLYESHQAIKVLITITMIIIIGQPWADPDSDTVQLNQQFNNHGNLWFTIKVSDVYSEQYD